MREAARRGEFRILYVHKVDRLARRLEWSLEIVHELQALDISFKAVEQPFDLRTPEGKLLFHRKPRRVLPPLGGRGMRASPKG